MTSNVKASKSVKVLFENIDSSSSSEEPPMEDWSSLILGQYSDNPKRIAYEEGLYDPGSGEICANYIPLSDSTVLQHVYYNYPSIKDPGISEALFRPEPQKVYDYDGQELYLDLCEEMKIVPVRDFYRGLLKDTINLRYYGVNSIGIRAMAMALSNNKYVRRLDITGSFLSPDACLHLGQMLGESYALQELVLCSCKLQAEGVKNLVVMLSTRSFELLDLSRNDIKDAGLKYLTTQISKGAIIKRLNLSYNDLGVDGAIALAEAYEFNNKVTNFDISWNRIFPLQGANQLIRTLGDNKKLEEVNMSWNGLIVGLSLRKLLTVPALRILDLSNNKLSTAAAKSIALRLPNATGLITLDISNNPMSPADALLILSSLREKAVKVRNLLMDNIVVSKDFMAQKEDILKLRFRAKTRITHGPVTKNYTLSIPDMRMIVMKRIDFLTARASKKATLDIALFFLSTQKTNEGPDIQVRLLYKYLMVAGVRIEMDLLEQIANIFPGQPTDKGAKTVHLPGVVEYIKRLWPEKHLPPTPPPPPPPPPVKSKKKKGIKKN